MASSKTRIPTRASLSAGPWTGVFDTPDPFDASPDKLRDALNIDIPDPENGSGAYARPGFGLGNQGQLVTALVGSYKGQAVHTHTALDGSLINFIIAAGKLLRIDDLDEIGSSVIEDVTPVGISINSGDGPIGITSLLDTIIVNDGLSPPWVGTDLTASPITGAYIDYDSLGTAWTAYGAPVVWQGSVVFILDQVGGVSRREDIAWSEPGTPGIGWEQTAFNNTATLTQTATGALFALVPTNLALYYTRAASIGAVAGDLFSNFSTSATHDAVSSNVGCTAWRTIQQAGVSIFFADALGRPYRLTPGAAPKPIWEQMRGITRHHGSNDAGQLTTFAASVIDPILNRYVVTLWRPDPAAATIDCPTTAYAFTADTGVYVGRWTIADVGAGGIDIAAMGLLTFDNNTPMVVVLGGNSPGAVGSRGYAWYLRGRGWPFPDSGQWLDHGTLPNITAMTNPMGESDDVNYTIDRVAVVTGNASSVQVTVQTPTTSGTIIGPAAVNGASQDGTYRVIVGVDGVQGRGPSVTVSPKTGDVTLDQWRLDRITVVAVPSTAGPEDL